MQQHASVLMYHLLKATADGIDATMSFGRGRKIIKVLKHPKVE